MITIAAPYVKASRRPLALSPERFKKNETVIGIIGHTQGVNNATKPPRKPRIKIAHNEESEVLVSSPNADRQKIIEVSAKMNEAKKKLDKLKGNK